MVRKISKEALLVSDTTTYSISNTTSDWVTKTTKNITLDSPAIVVIDFTVAAYAAPVSGKVIGGNGRLLVDNVPVICSGELHYNPGSGSVNRRIYLVLPAGNHTLDFQLACFANTGTTTDPCNVRLYDIYIRKLMFSDVGAQRIDSGLVSAANAATTTVLDVNFIVPSRRTVAGPLNQVPLKAFFLVYGDGSRTSRMKNPGEAEDAALNWKLFINDVQTKWTERKGDFDSGDTTNASYAESAYGFYEALRTAGETINFKVKVYNNTGGAKNVRATLCIFACPWIIGPSEYQPFQLSFPPGSTLYVVLEPLSADPTKNLKIGYVRAWNLNYNYYYTASGTGIVEANYTFEKVDPSESVIRIDGNGGCISIIGVDVR